MTTFVKNRVSLRAGWWTVAILFFLVSSASGEFALLYKKNGSGTYKLGHSVDAAGDVNGDGKDDFIVGAPAYSGWSGAAFVYSGANGSLLYQKFGATYEEFGYSVGGAGDVNGDGKADFIIGTYKDTGSVYVYSGANGNLLYQINGAGGSSFGYSVNGAGDVNGDGKADFIVGAPTENPNKARVFSGATGGLLYQKNGYGQFGYSVAGTGDVNGDGKADFIVGAPDSGNGSASVYSGADGSLIYQKNSTYPVILLGLSVDGAGDVNADGKADFIVGAPLTETQEGYTVGSAYVYSGANGNVLYSKEGAFSSGSPPFFGWSVAKAGDTDADGKGDFIIGAPRTDTASLSEAGAAYLYSGADGSLLFQRTGTASGDSLGYSVSGGLDMKADGFKDILIGIPSFDTSGYGDAGSVLAYNRRPVERSERRVFDVNPRVAVILPSFSLEQNYPNPFNPTTRISFSLDEESNVQLEVFNILGEKVRTLINEVRSAGNSAVVFDGRDGRGIPLSSGLYFYRIKTDHQTVTKQMILVK